MPCFSREAKRKARVRGSPFGAIQLLGRSATVAAEFANDDPDEPEASGEEDQGCIQDEVPESVVLTHDCVPFKWVVGVYYMPCFSREAKRKARVEGLPL